jgi:hypothetical protein
LREKAINPSRFGIWFGICTCAVANRFWSVAAGTAGHPNDTIWAQQSPRLGVGYVFLPDMHAVAIEVGDFRRFANARQPMAYLGLVPSEHSSGASIRRGGITQAGNVLARRVLIEGAWTHRMPARVSRKLHERNEKLSPRIRDIARKAQLRL